MEFRTESIDVVGRRLSMSTAGTGPAVVFEAGSGCSSLDWDAVRHQLGNDVRTVAYDRAGYGASDPARYQYPTGRVDDLAAVVDRASPDAPVVLVGHSFGSHLIRLLAARSPHRVAGLVLVD